MKIPKYIKNKINRMLELKELTHKLSKEIDNWLEDNGVDTQSEKYIDGLGVRLLYAELVNADEFENELQKFLNGEEIGYG